jgi:peptidoglycan/xylan/chitin deacetylase (PgdA/CDA1 family)
VREKRILYDDVYGWLRSMKSEDELRKVVRDLAARHGVDMATVCADECMDWDELSQIAADPLCTIGAHTVNHVMLKKIGSEHAVRAEMEQSRAVIEAALGKRPHHLSYPVGDPTSAGQREFRIASELGFKTAVTTRPGVIFRKHREHLTALPRISVNGEFQRQRYLKVLMSGSATAMWNGFRRVNAA